MQCRQAYTENDDELMWKFLVHKSRSRVGDPIQPMGIAIWKEYVDEYRDCGRSYSSLQSHFRRHLLDNIERANLPLKDLLFLIRHLGRPLQRHQKTFIEKKFGCNLLVDQKGLPRMEVVWVTDDRAEDGGAFVPVEEHRTADPPPPQEDDDGWMDAPLRRGSPERNEIIVPLVQRRQSRDAVGTGNRTSEEVMEEEGSPHEDARERSISPSPHEDVTPKRLLKLEPRALSANI
uniref:HTH OST-type domain-containing protein n=1 Tax=Steinernema glaseri TaxID=37863 RepID=A0A1I7ZIU4_9BILA